MVRPPPTLLIPCIPFLGWMAAAVYFPLEAIADIVHLKNGKMVEGDVSPGNRPGYIRIVMDKGLAVEYSEKDIVRIEKKKSPAQEFQERLTALPPGDIDALYELAQWARERKLRSREEELYRRIMKIDPNDPIARRELGFVVFKNRWVKESDLRKKHGLIQFRGDWLTPEEKERRILEELKKEISDLMRDVDSDNKYIQKYSIKKLLEYSDLRASAVVLQYLGHEREAVRIVAVQMLAGLVLKSRDGKNRKSRKKAPPPPAGPGEEVVARALLERILQEESQKVRIALGNAIHKIKSRRFFELALEALHSSNNALHRDRAAEGVLFALRKAWMSNLIQALTRRPRWVGPTTRGNPQVKSILVKIARQDFGYDQASWIAWWDLHQQNYADGD